jgi:acyl-CoA synthetase (AMP-forming)/AMP-acid ligase II
MTTIDGLALAGLDDPAPQTIWEIVEWRARRTGDALFAEDERGIRLTFRQLRDAALRVAAGLFERGVRADSVVSWQLPTWIEAATLSLALARLGAVQNPLIPILGVREVSFICDQLASNLLVVPGVWRGVDYDALAADVRRSSPALDVLSDARTLPTGDPAILPAYEPPGPDVTKWVYYTSGTTADPKGARHSDATVIAGSVGFSTALGLRADDVVTFVIPLTHVGGIIYVLGSLLSGCELGFAESFVPDTTTAQIRERQTTVVPGSLPFVQSFFTYLDQHPELEPLFPRGRMMTHGGSPKPPQFYYDVKARLGLKIVTGYGMTECPMLAWNRPEDDDEDLASTEGRPVDGVEVTLVNPDGTLAELGDEGEIRVRGPMLMLGYVDPALDVGAVDEDGFFRSGDLGRLTPSGHLTITGRLKDVIIRNMENISANELENLLFTHPLVRDVAVIGLPDERTGERACAVVVPVNAAEVPTLDELAAHLLAAGLSKRKLPEQVEFVEELPVNAMKKVLKAELRRQFLVG